MVHFRMKSLSLCFTPPPKGALTTTQITKEPVQLGPLRACSTRPTNFSQPYVISRRTCSGIPIGLLSPMMSET